MRTIFVKNDKLTVGTILVERKNSYVIQEIAPCPTDRANRHIVSVNRNNPTDTNRGCYSTLAESEVRL